MQDEPAKAHRAEHRDRGQGRAGGGDGNRRVLFERIEDPERDRCSPERNREGRKEVPRDSAGDCRREGRASDDC